MYFCFGEIRPLSIPLPRPAPQFRCQERLFLNNRTRRKDCRLPKYSARGIPKGSWADKEAKKRHELTKHRDMKKTYFKGGRDGDASIFFHMGGENYFTACCLCEQWPFLSWNFGLTPSVVRYPMPSQVSPDIKRFRRAQFKKIILRLPAQV